MLSLPTTWQPQPFDLRRAGLVALLVCACGQRQDSISQLQASIEQELARLGVSDFALSCQREQDKPVCVLFAADGSNVFLEVAEADDGFNWRLPEGTIDTEAIRDEVAGSLAQVYGSAPVYCGPRFRVASDEVVRCVSNDKLVLVEIVDHGLRIETLQDRAAVTARDSSGDEPGLLAQSQALSTIDTDEEGPEMVDAAPSDASR